MSRKRTPARGSGQGALSSPPKRSKRRQSARLDDGYSAEGKAPDPKAAGVDPEAARSLIATCGPPRMLPSPLHSSSSCLSGDTPILMADGTARTLATVKVGDTILGTVAEGAERRYLKTEVLAHWSVIGPAYRILLVDGTEIIAGGDHRFLTTLGWKCVAEGQSTIEGTEGAPPLTCGDQLLGTGAFAPAPAQDLEYRRGYLCGLFRGYASPEPRPRVQGRARLMQRPAPLMPCSGEAWERAERWLHEWCEPEPQSVPLAMAAGAGHRVRIVRTPAACPLTGEIEDAIRWPAIASRSWSAGFLGGIYDAAGSCEGGALRICHSDAAVLGRVGEALRLLNIERRLELVKQRGRAPIAGVQVLGGLAGQLRFFHSCDPATGRGDIVEKPVTGGKDLAVVAIEPLRVGRRLHAITTGTGDFIANGVVSHNCDGPGPEGIELGTCLSAEDDAAGVVEQELARSAYVRRYVSSAVTRAQPPGPPEARLARLDIPASKADPAPLVIRATLVLQDLTLLGMLAEVPGELRAAAPAVTADLLQPILMAAEAGALWAGYVLAPLPHAAADFLREWPAEQLADRAHVMALVQSIQAGRANGPPRVPGAGPTAILCQRLALARCRPESAGVIRPGQPPLVQLAFRGRERVRAGFPETQPEAAMAGL